MYDNTIGKMSFSRGGKRDLYYTMNVIEGKRIAEEILLSHISWNLKKIQCGCQAENFYF